MKRILIFTGIICMAAAVLLGGVVGGFFLNPRLITSVAFGVNTAPVELPLRDSFKDRAPDAKTSAIVSAADAFLGSLDTTQRDAATYAFSDNEQRSKWSNFPEGMIPRGGLRIGTLSEQQYALMDALIAEFMSEDGVRNIDYQLAAERTFPTDDPFGEYGVDKFYVAFLGEPSETQPWMFQFGGHHLGINVTVYGADVTFSPMLTGGQPLYIDYEGKRVFIIQDEVDAAQAVLESLTDLQKADAVRGDAAINLLLGPGEYGTVVAPEGVKGSDLSPEQKNLLISLIQTRLGFINDNDNAAKIQTVMAELDDTYFGWWGPQDAPGFAYYRITAPSTVIEYAPQDALAESPEQEHAHSMYRNPSNDYGAAWIGAK
ncbi:DUF3500 domain-containing protein [Roseibium sp. RKSG952]|uniref:DUF3500 domain-containing protein n=1 Tax=Roseibium sp. RKSG952 TaxID=2529384 RepID=UPI0012BD4D57|nr:DUF3500 domain-containing protein [Roseibium sp. RKSG952]MTI01014.1 DUF3500 domain-containing protein [Roseibium sp. RKSG952]